MNLNQGYSSGGSVSSAQSAGWSQSGTMAEQARAWSEAQANTAWSRSLDAMDRQMAFNAMEAQKQRDWEERMANTIYTRSVKNMREAGINPILAANMGLSGASVGSGATASIGGAPSAPVAQNFMDSWSASENASQSHGSSWSSSENGLMTALTALGGFLTSAMDKLSSSMNVNFSLEGLEKILGERGKEFANTIDNAIDEVTGGNGAREMTEHREQGIGYWRNGIWWDRDDSKTQRNKNKYRNGYLNS